MIGMNSLKQGNFVLRSNCRICGSKKMYMFLSLDSTPLANNFLKKEHLSKTEAYYPLEVSFCKNCYLVQLIDIVSPQTLFKEYFYLTSASEPMKIHFSRLAEDLIKKLRLKKNSLIVDVGSNDGTLLKSFLKSGFRVLGIEPASNVSDLARSEGVNTVNEFFTINSAQKLCKEYGKADIILTTNVFAHVDDLENFMSGIDYWLTDNGCFIVEVPYLVNLLKNREFDTIYHEHLSYFSLHPLVYLFKKFKMNIVDVKEINVHGGSIRIFVKRFPNKQTKRVTDMLSKEKRSGIGDLKTYLKFTKAVVSLKEKIANLLINLKEKGVKICGYGATAKGNTLLNYCNIDTRILDYIIDTTPFKQGCYTPGTHIPIFSELKFRENQPDYALILAWNYANEIIKKEAIYIENNGKFILPIPEPKII